MRKLTKREKTMLYILALIIILICGFYFFLIPEYNAYSQMKSQVEETKLTAYSIRQNIENSEAVREKADEMSSELSSESSVYYPPMAEWELDNLITGMLQKHNLKPQSLQVSLPTETAITNFGDKATATQTTNAASSGTSDEGKMIVSRIQADVQGTKSDFIALTDEINSNPSIHINGFYMDSSSSNNEAADMTIDMEVLMYDDLSSPQ